MTTKHTDIDAARLHLAGLEIPTAGLAACEKRMKLYEQAPALADALKAWDDWIRGAPDEWAKSARPLFGITRAALKAAGVEP